MVVPLADIERLLEKIFDVIKRAHENELIHAGIIKTYKEVTLIVY